MKKLFKTLKVFFRLKFDEIIHNHEVEAFFAVLLLILCLGLFCLFVGFIHFLIYPEFLLDKLFVKNCTNYYLIFKIFLRGALDVAFLVCCGFFSWIVISIFTTIVKFFKWIASNWKKAKETIENER